MNLPSFVQVCEVCPRDGFQNETEWIPTDDKVAIIRKLASTGIKSIEITSFVHPKAIPQLKDSEEVVRRTQDLTDIHFRALVPNLIGAQRAIDVGIKKLKLMLSATDAHSLSNANRKVEEAQEQFLPIMLLAEHHNVKVGGAISVAFGCPYEGKVPLEKLIPIIRRYQNMGITEISLADTTGMANPFQISEYLKVLRSEFSAVTFSMHLHNTRGMALANAIAAMEQGITHFDASAAGLGGCPYAPGASGNIATEDFVHSLHEMGIDTGIQLDRLLEAAKDIKRIIGHDGGSFVLNAGTCQDLHAKPVEQVKLS
jgi:hydroxymethylglutaryl-CoA lyase